MDELVRFLLFVSSLQYDNQQQQEEQPTPLVQDDTYFKNVVLLLNGEA